jgi:hypothetical protein
VAMVYSVFSELERRRAQGNTKSRVGTVACRHLQIHCDSFDVGINATQGQNRSSSHGASRTAEAARALPLCILHTGSLYFVY